MKTAAITCRHLVKYAAPSLSDLTDEHLTRASSAGGKTAGWILGHLCITGDFVRRKAGRPPFTPKEWGPKFAPGTSAPVSAADYPRMSELRETFNRIYTDLADSAPDFPAELLAGPNPFEPARPRFTTFAEFLSWIMSGHLGYHLGQLSEWRAAQGMPLRPGATSPWA
jgi:hypothetical protein